MFTLSPVRGFLPMCSGRRLPANVPNARTVTFSAAPGDSPIAEKTISTAVSAASLDSRAFVGSAFHDLGFFHLRALLQ